MKSYKIIIFSFIIYMLAVVTTYFSMYEYSKDMSSSCFECSYKRDVFLSSVCVSVVFLLLVLLKKARKKNWYIPLWFSLIFVLLVFFNNYSIFVDRVSSWSTFTFIEELISTLSDSCLCLGISTMIVFVLLKFYKF